MITTTETEAAMRQDELRALWGDEGTGVCIPAGVAHAGVRMHRCQRGNVSLLVLFMGLVFYALAAMVWNTGELTTAKIEAQNAADSAAYSSVVWTSRAVNIVAATNAVALRDASAIGVAGAVLFEGTWVLVWQTIYFVQNIVPLLSGLPFTLPALLPLLALYVQDLVQWIIFVSATGWPVSPIIDIIDLGLHLSDIMEYQREWVAVMPGLIAAQADQVEAYYDCDVQLLRGDGDPNIGPPLHEGTQLTCLVPLTARFAYDALATDSWYKDTGLRAMIIGKGKTGWLIGSALGYVAALVALGESHHVLSSQPPYSPLEFGPFGTGLSGGPQTWADYTVTAGAKKRASNAASRQLPLYPLRFMAPGLFGDSDSLRPVAYSQAETFNGIDGIFSTVNVGGFQLLQPIISLYPWRVWTDWGWQWQPRLTHGSLLMPEVFQGMGLALPAFSPQFRETVSTH